MIIKFKDQRYEIHLAEFLFLLGIFLKQFYLRRSGTIQISDAVIMLSLIVLIVSHRLRYAPRDLPLIIFTVCVFIINGVYETYYGVILAKNYSTRFIMAAAYMLYNLAVIIAFRIYIQKPAFLNALALTIKLNLVTQFVIHLLGMGRYYWGVYRYQGTFNDPNQFGFFVICCLFILFLCSVYFDQKLHLIWYALAGYLVLLSSSRGMAFAFLLFLLFAIIIPFLSERHSFTRIILVLGFLAIVAVFLTGGFSILSAVQSGNKSFSFLVERTISKLGSGDILQRINTFLNDRSLVRILYAPHYFLFGSGEGYWERFYYTSDHSEMHCTMLALCYYYGIIPYTFFLKWLKDNLKGIPLRSYGVYIALILEAFTLINHRQPLFWMILAMGSLLAEKSCEKDTEKSMVVTPIAGKGQS